MLMGALSQFFVISVNTYNIVIS